MLTCKGMRVQTHLLFVAFTFVLQMSSFNCDGSFSYELFNAIKPKTQLVLSPSAVHNVVGISYFGSVGDTAKELQDSLYFAESKEEVAKNLKSQNAYSSNVIYVNKTLKLTNEFKKYAVYQIEAKNKFIDFSLGHQAVERIIEYINHQSKSHLKHLYALKRVVDVNSSVVEVNVVNFEAEWKTPFETEFQVQNVTMMRRFGSYLYGQIKELNAEAVLIPFKNAKNNMLLVLPDKAEHLDSVKEKLKHFAPRIDSRLKPTQLDLYLPKFDLDRGLLLNEALHDLKLKVPFQKDANFTHMLNGGINSYIDHVHQATKAAVDLNKVHIKSATVVQWKLISSISNNRGEVSMHEDQTETLPILYVNRPFIFAVRTQGRILALGAVSNNFNLIKISA